MSTDIEMLAPEDAAPPEPPPAAKQEAPERKRARRFYWPAWALRVSIESVLMIFSIVSALAVDEWRESRQHRQLAQQSLQIFEREMKANLALLEEVAPYHQGLRSVVAQAMANPANAPDMQSIVEGLQPTRPLLNTAWQTALATGALTHIDVRTVSAISLAYSFQERFRQQSSAERPAIPVGAPASRQELARQISEAYTYLNAVVAAEEELRAAYKQAIEIIRSGMKEPIGPDSTRNTSVVADSP